jgi:hypothetical protein
MNDKRRPWRRWLAVFFAGCILLGSSLAYATSLFWSYPNDHILITEVNYQGAPGTGPGTQWIELYNPMDEDMPFVSIEIVKLAGVAFIPTPTPPVPSTPTTYSFSAGCFLYLAHDAGAFYTAYGQCPDYARFQDGVNCPDTQSLSWNIDVSINEANDTLCAFIRTEHATPGAPLEPAFFTDAVGWGTGGAGTRCGPVDHPLPAPALTPGVTYLRGSDDPWIGPGAEGDELPGEPLTEQLAEVWNLSSDVNVSWAGPEVGACRMPTAVTMQHTQANTVQNSGIVLALVGFIGLLTLAVLWKPQSAEA